MIFGTILKKRKGHCSIMCSFYNWKLLTAQINEIKGHLALYCRKVFKDAKVFYLEEVKKTTIKSLAKKKLDQPKIYEKFESTRIDDSKTMMQTGLSSNSLHAVEYHSTS